MERFKKHIPLILIFILICQHIPFFNADPDTLSDLMTRGAWADEGCYSSQIRNYIQSGKLSLTESSTLVRGPLFGLMQLILFKSFGINLLSARLFVLGITIAGIFVFAKTKEYKFFIILVIGIIMTQPHIFQFSHYALSEMICNSMILFSLYFLIKSFTESVSFRKKLFLFLSIMFVSFSWFLKIQFLYAIIIVPLTCLSFAIIEWVKEKKLRWKKLNFFYLSIGYTFIFLLVYYFCWYLPNQKIYMYIMRTEYAGRYPNTVWPIIQLAYYNIRHELFGVELRMYFFTLIIIFVLTIGFLIYKKKKDIFFMTPILFSFFWILSEFHKLPLHYLPNRYLLGLIAACGILISALISELMLTKKNYIHMLVFSLSATLITLNLFNDYKIFQRRTFHLQQANDYLSKYKFGKDPVIGAWASSLCWKNEAITIPVWNHYFNWQDPINKYHPRIVVSEKNESDSDSTYYFQNIKLNSLADSTKEFDLWRTKVMLYWIKKK